MMRWITFCFVLAALAGFCTTSVRQAAAAPIRPTIVIDERGVAMGDNYFQTPADAETSGSLMESLDMNGLRLIYRWSNNSSLERWQITSICNAAQAMLAHHVTTIVLNPLPFNTGWPNTDDGRTKFVEDLNVVLNLLLNRSNGCAMQPGPNGQLEPGLVVKVLPVNEPNIDTFCDPGVSDDNLRHQICADWTVRLDHAVYQDVAQLAGYYGTIPVIGMALGSHHNPLGFLSQFFKARSALGYTSEVPACVGYHPYSLLGSSDPLSGVRTTPDFQKALTAGFGQDVRVCYTESGLETNVSPDQGYTCSPPQDAMQVDVDQYPYWQNQMYRLATRYGVDSIYNFGLYDEQCLNPGWQSGYLTWDGKKKPTWDAMRALLAQAADPPDG